MFSFIEDEELDKNVSNNYIDEVEKKLNIKFPSILREYYLKHNYSNAKECTFKIEWIDDAEFILDCIIPLKYGTSCFEKEFESRMISDYIPFAYDMDSDKYYWNLNTGKVYYISHENAENPILICNSVADFFNILNKSCNEKIIIPNLNVLEKSNVLGTDSVRKILKYDGKFLHICILVCIILVVISLLCMSFTDGLSIIIAGVSICWGVIFLIIDITSFIITKNTLKKYDVYELQSELENAFKLDGIDTYLTKNYIISNSKIVKITKYSDIAWIFTDKARGTVSQQAIISSAYKLGGTPVIAYLKNGKKVVVALVNSREHLNKIYGRIQSENNDVLIGETPENIKKYESVNKYFKMKNKFWNILLVGFILIMIIGFIYVNFIK